MADRHDLTSASRRSGASNPGAERTEEDPLVELARIVSGRSAYADTSRRRSPLTADRTPTDADLARDLEAELLSDLQASFAASRRADDRDDYGRAPAYAADDDGDYSDYAGARQDEGDEAAQDYVYDPAGYPVADGDPATDGYPPVAGAADDDAGSYDDYQLRSAPETPDDAGAFDPYQPEDDAYAAPETGAVYAEDEDVYPGDGQDSAETYAADDDEAPAYSSDAAETGFLQEPYLEEPYDDGMGDDPSPGVSARLGNDLDGPYQPSDEESFPPYPVALRAGEDDRYDGDYDGDPADSEADYDLDDDLSEPPRRGLRKEVLAIGAILAIVLVGGAAAIMLRPGAGTGDTAAPVFLADDTPTKEEPPPQEQQTAAADPSKLIYDRVGGEGPIDADGPETLAPQDDEVIADIPQITAPESEGSREISRIILPGAPDDDSVARPRSREFDAEAANAEAGDGSSPAAGTRRVRTVVVRPDGTIVSSEAAPVGEAPPAADVLAAAENLSNNDPAAIAAESGQLVPPREDETNLQPDPDSVGTVVANGPVPRPNPERDQVAAATPVAAEPPPVRNVEVRTVTEPPAAREPAPQRQAARDEPISLMPSAPAEPAPAQRAPQASGNFLVQVASQRSEAEALAAFRSLQNRLPQYLSGRQPDVQRADLGARGTFYRVRVGPPTSRDEANRLCASLKAAGADCIVAQN